MRNLTENQFAHAAALEERLQRIDQMHRMSQRELRELLCGDSEKAMVWVRSAAEHGVAAAQLRLGRMLLEGVGTARNEAAALRWFECAAREGDAEAMNMVGRCHENGWGTPVSLPLAVASYYESAARGHEWGEYNLANMLFDGRGVDRDPEQALYWYLSAARRGHARAMNLAGRCLEEGWGCTRSAAQAAEWYRRSAEAGYFRGQFNYALVLLERGDRNGGTEWLRRAASLGDSAMREAVDAVLRCSGIDAAAGAHPEVSRSNSGRAVRGSGVNRK